MLRKTAEHPPSINPVKNGNTPKRDKGPNNPNVAPSNPIINTRDKPNTHQRPNPATALRGVPANPNISLNPTPAEPERSISTVKEEKHKQINKSHGKMAGGARVTPCGQPAAPILRQT